MTAQYDPETGSIRLGADATPYELAHERAHEYQHRYQTLAWRCHRIGGTAPYLGRILRLWLEWEAAIMALRALEFCRHRDRAADTEASRGLASYILALFIPWKL